MYMELASRTGRLKREQGQHERQHWQRLPAWPPQPNAEAARFLARVSLQSDDPTPAATSAPLNSALQLCTTSPLPLGVHLRCPAHSHAISAAYKRGRRGSDGCGRARPGASRHPHDALQ